jgi:hypothetical protein
MRSSSMDSRAGWQAARRGGGSWDCSWLEASEDPAEHASIASAPMAADTAEESTGATASAHEQADVTAEVEPKSLERGWHAAALVPAGGAATAWGLFIELPELPGNQDGGTGRSVSAVETTRRGAARVTPVLGVLAGNPRPEDREARSPFA